MLNAGYLEEMYNRYIGYMQSDLGLLQLSEYDVINGNVSDHLCQIHAYIATFGIDDEHFLSKFERLVLLYERRLYDTIPDEKDIIEGLVQWHAKIIKKEKAKKA